MRAIIKKKSSNSIERLETKEEFNEVIDEVLDFLKKD